VVWAIGSATPSLAHDETELLPGFQQTEAFQGLSLPTDLDFAADGRVFVAEKAGVVRIFDSLGDQTPDTLIDLNVNIHDYWDRGLLAIAVDSDFPAQPFVYLLYTYNRDFQDGDASTPTWPDSCPDPPGGTSDGCVVDARVSRVEVAPDNSLVGGEQVLREGRWCQQWPSHSVGDLVFDASNRVLYVSAGDGAAFTGVDYGQHGGSTGSPVPANPCGDPPGRGVLPSPPSAEGGALRSQDLRTSGDPVSFDGTVIALDPDTGLAAPGSPLIGGDPDDDPIIAYGLRNPFRMAVRPGGNDVWVGDVGWSIWEEINRIVDPSDPVIENFGWPCYEGPAPQTSYSAQGLAICDDLYADTLLPARAPYYGYQHFASIDPDPEPFRCTKSGSSSIAGLTFYDGGNFPAEYEGALFFADYSRDCIFVMEASPDGLPDPDTRSAFADGVANPVTLEVGPDGALYYLDIEAGRIMRIIFSGTNQPPQAELTASATNGTVPLQVQLDGSGSVDPDSGQPITFEWDLDGDGQFDDAFDSNVEASYSSQGEYPVSLRVTDNQGATDTEQLVITAGNTAPSATIDAPLSTDLWRVGDSIAFQGQATDPEEGQMAAADVRWDILLHHCPGGPDDCHQHPVQTLEGVLGGFFSAPDHEFYSFLEVRMSATDGGFPGGGGGVLVSEVSVSIEPEAADLDISTTPPGLSVSVGATSDPAPFVKPMIVNSTLLITAVSPQDLGGKRYGFVSWSDASDRSHQRLMPDTTLSLSADYQYVGTASNWWDAQWRQRTKVTLDNSQQSEALLDFPVLVRLFDPRIDYSRTMNSGQDIRFVDADGNTPLPYEIERWDEGGVSTVWVRVPRIDAGSAVDHFWMYYDNPGQSDSQNPAGVWSPSHVGVWHLDSDLADSSGAGHHGTDFGTSPAIGRIAGARQFDGNDWIDVGTSALLEQTGDVTVEAWVRLDDPTLPGEQVVLSKQSSLGDSTGYGLDYDGATQVLAARSSGLDIGAAAGVGLDTNWHHLAAVIGGARCELFVDGVDQTTDTSCSGLVPGGQSLAIGALGGGALGTLGAIDEVRIADGARSAAWMRAQFLSTTDQFVTVGASEDNCGPSDDICDGFDDDCDGQQDEDYGGEATTCGLGTCQRSGTLVCNGGNLLDTCLPGFPSLTDAVCDGLDEDCDGFVDEDTDTGAGTYVLRFEDKTRLGWNGTSGTQYDLVRGDLGLLVSSGGQFELATEECVANRRSREFFDYVPNPSPGTGHWFVLRREKCDCFCSYDAANASQPWPRDSEIDASGNGCR
jgi:glucose/arabinose dehydrogenase